MPNIDDDLLIKEQYDIINQIEDYDLDEDEPIYEDELTKVSLSDFPDELSADLLTGKGYATQNDIDILNIKEIANYDDLIPRKANNNFPDIYATLTEKINNYLEERTLTPELSLAIYATLRKSVTQLYSENHINNLVDTHQTLRGEYFYIKSRAGALAFALDKREEIREFVDDLVDSSPLGYEDLEKLYQENYGPDNYDYLIIENIRDRESTYSYFNPDPDKKYTEEY